MYLGIFSQWYRNVEMCREETGSKYRRRKGWKINDRSNARARAREGVAASANLASSMRCNGRKVQCHRIDTAVSRAPGTRHTHIKLTIDERGYWLGQ